MASLSTLKKALAALEKQPGSIRHAQTDSTIFNESLCASGSVLSDISSDNIHVVDSAMDAFYAEGDKAHDERSRTASSYVEQAIGRIQSEIATLENGGPNSNEYC